VSYEVTKNWSGAVDIPSLTYEPDDRSSRARVRSGRLSFASVPMIRHRAAFFLMLAKSVGPNAAAL